MNSPASAHTFETPRMSTPSVPAALSAEDTGVSSAVLTKKRRGLQEEFDKLTPVPEDSLMRAADLLDNFGFYMETCEGKIENKMSY
jgi:hypothetical protein